MKLYKVILYQNTQKVINRDLLSKNILKSQTSECICLLKATNHHINKP